MELPAADGRLETRSGPGCRQLHRAQTRRTNAAVDHGEWFLQLSDEIIWDVGDKDDGNPRARITMRTGDICAMPADIRHQGYSTKRSMLLVWENATPNLPQRYESGELTPYPIEF